MFEKKRSWSGQREITVGTGENQRKIYVPAYTFEVQFSGLDENTTYPLIITDTLDATARQYLQYVTGSTRIYGGDIYSINDQLTHWDQQANQNVADFDQSQVSYDPSTGVITFSINKADLPTRYNNEGQRSTELYGYYKVVYDVMVPDETTYLALQSAAMATNDKKITMGNAVHSTLGDSSTTVTYEPNILSKWQWTQDNKLYFTIEVNKDKLDMSASGDVIKLEDHLTNLSVQYTDITVEVKDPQDYTPVLVNGVTDALGNAVYAPYFNMEGDDITFWLPDNAYVQIIYSAKAVGAVNSEGKIEYKNEADLYGYKKEVSDSRYYDVSGGGMGINYGVKLYKADADVNSKKLGGAVFKVFQVDEEDAEGNIISATPLKYEKDVYDTDGVTKLHSIGDDYTVTSSATGYVEIKGHSEIQGWNLKPETHYYIQEVQAPEGYAINDIKYSFTISAKGYVNYSSTEKPAPDGSGVMVAPWTFLNGDVLTVKDKKREGQLTITKQFNGMSANELDDDERAGIVFKLYKYNDATSAYQSTPFKTIGYDQFTNGSYTVNDLVAGKYKVVEEVTGDSAYVGNAYVVTNEADTAQAAYAEIVVSSEDVNSAEVHHTLTLTNTYNPQSELKVLKTAEGQASHKLAGAQFALKDGSGNVKETYTTNSRGRFSVLKTENINYDTLYTLVETNAPAGFKVNTTEYKIVMLSSATTPERAANENDADYNTRVRNAANSLNIGVNNDTIVIPYNKSVDQTITDAIDTTSVGGVKIWRDENLQVVTTLTDEQKTVPVMIKVVASYDKAGTKIEPAQGGYVKDATTRKSAKFNLVYDDTNWNLVDDNSEHNLYVGSTARQDSGISIVNGRLAGLPEMEFMPDGTLMYYSYSVEEPIYL